MRTTIDIPEQIYRELKLRAATEGTTMRKIILESLRAKPELLGPVEICQDSPLPAGRVESSIPASRYIDSGFAIASNSAKASLGKLPSACDFL